MEFTACTVCNSTNIYPIKGYEKAWLVKCRSCSFVFSKYIPSEQELNDYYSRYPYFKIISPVTIKRFNSLLDLLEKYRSTNNILDVGCGEGFFLEQAMKRGWEAHGTEYAEH